MVRLGSREVVDAVGAAAHRAPSPALAAALRRWPGAHYWSDPARTGLVLIRPVEPEREERWALHAFLAALTVICALGAGAALAAAVPATGPR